MNEQLSLEEDTSVVNQNTTKLSLFPTNTLSHTPEYEEDLADKYSAAMGPISPGRDAMLAAMRSGGEQRYRELLAQQQAIAVDSARTQVVNQIAQAGAATPFDMEIVQGLSEDQLYSPDLGTILEEEYSRKITDLTASLLEEENGAVSESINTNVDAAYESIDRAQWQTARNFIASNILDSVQQKFNNSGLLVQGVAWAQQIVPFRDQVALWGAELGDVEKSFFTGDTKKDAYAYLSTLPPADVKRILESYVDRELQTNNYLNAINFVSGFLSYSDTDAAWDTVFEGLDVAPIGLLTKGLKGAARAVTVPVKETERAAALAGLPAEANRVLFNQALQAGVLPSRNIKSISDIERIVPSIARPQELFNGGKALRAGGPALTRLEQAVVARAGTAMQILTDVNRVERLTPTEIEKGFSEAEDFLRNNFVHGNHKIVNVIRNMAEDSISNTYSVGIQIGKTDGTAFASKLGAQSAAKTIRLRTNDFEIVELPTGGWVVQVNRNVDESSLGLRSVKVDTDYKLPDNWATRFLSGALGADSLLSKSQTTARGVSVLSSEHMGHMLEEFSRPVARLNKKGRKELEEFIIRDKDRIDPKNGRAMVHLTPHDFETAFYDQFNKLPTYDQMDAYMAYRQLYDLDWLVRDLDVYKQKVSMGIEKFSMRVKGKDGLSDVSLEGKEITEFPRGTRESFTIGVVDDGGNLVKSNGYNSRYMNTKDWDNIKRLQDEGYKIIQPFTGSKKLNDDYFTFILVRNFKRDNLKLDQLSYSKNSRVTQRSPYYLKQPNVRVKDGRAYYTRDTSIANVRSYDEAVAAAKIMDQARLMVKNRSPGVVKFFQDNIPFISLKDYLKQVRDGKMSLDAPIKVTKGGSRTIDAYNIADDLRKEGLTINEFVTNNEFNLSNRVTGRFLGEKGDVNMDSYGVEKDTIFKLEGDSIMSPFDTMRYAMGDMVDTHIIGDYRLKSARDFTKTYGDILDGDSFDFDSDGLGFIFEPRYRKDADPNLVRSAEGQRKAIMSLFNNKTIVEKQVDMYKEKLVNSLRSKGGDNVANWVEDKALPAISNLDVAMRAFAFHSKMGFFNIRQLFLQSTAAVNVISIAGRHGIKGSMASWPLIFSLNTRSSFIKDLGKKLQGITTFSPEEFEELALMYRRSGFHHVGGDVAYLDNFKPPSVVKGKVGQLLELGALPFRTGERIARTMAFSAAYSERKALLGAKKMSRADEAWILQRAKDLTGNMTRDSNAAYQRGYGAIATQFFGYQMRLMEQFWGSKLTNMEKTRLFAGMSLAYGMPVAAGMSIGVWPVREWLKDEMAKAGVSYDATIAEPFMDGMVSQFFEATMGMDLNISERYGPGGLSTFYDLLKGDSDFQEILLGASGGIIGETLKDANPIVHFLFSSLDLNDTNNYPVTTSDLMEPFRNISTVNNTIKLWEALHTGQWLSQNETFLTDVSELEAMTSAIFGVDPERVSDAFNKVEALASRRDMQSDRMKEMVIDYRRGLQLLKDGFPNEAAQYFSRVKAKGINAGLTPRQMTDVYNRAIDGRPLDQTIEDQYSKYILNRK